MSEPKEIYKLLEVQKQIENASDEKELKKLHKQKQKLLNSLRKKAAKEYEIKNITYEKRLLSNTYKYKGTPLEKHMQKMFKKGYRVQVQTKDGGEVQIFKTFVKVSIFGALGLIGNRAPKKVEITYVKEPSWFQLLPQDILQELKIYK